MRFFPERTFIDEFVRASTNIIVLAIVFLPGCTESSIVPPPAVPAGTSFQFDVKPIFEQRGCLGCHGGNGGLVLATVPDILRGGVHGPAIAPGNADSSLIIKKLSPLPPFGNRMPFGGPYLSDSTIQTIRNWINEGAKNN